MPRFPAAAAGTVVGGRAITLCPCPIPVHNIIQISFPLLPPLAGGAITHDKNCTFPVQATENSLWQDGHKFNRTKNTVEETLTQFSRLDKFKLLSVESLLSGSFPRAEEEEGEKARILCRQRQCEGELLQGQVLSLQRAALINAT